MKIENINIRNVMSEAVKLNAVIIDVRDRNEFLQGHIPMAINIPLEKIKSDNFNVPRGKPLILYCERGASSMYAARILSNRGYRAINCVGGLLQYKKSLTKGS